MKFFEIMKKIFGYILTFVFYCYVIIMTLLLLNYNDYGVTEIYGTSLIIVKEQISSDKYKKGDLVLVESQKLDFIKENDEIFVYKIDNKGNANIEFGKVGEIHKEELAISLENGSTYSEEFIIGKGTKSYNNIGMILSFLGSKWGFLFTVLLPSFIFFIYQVYILIVEIKYGNEE